MVSSWTWSSSKLYDWSQGHLHHRAKEHAMDVIVYSTTT